MTVSNLPKGCLLVGSAPFQNTEETFQKCLKGMPGRLRRVPDGETGKRWLFVSAQGELLREYSPKILANLVGGFNKDYQEVTSKDVDDEMAQLKGKPFNTKYDDAAIESYAKFKEFKSNGTIPKDVKFQVCLPTATNVIGIFIDQAFKAAFEPIYEDALFRALRNIQDHIPHDDLAIQLDLAIDTALFQGLMDWWSEEDRKVGVVKRIVKMMGHVDKDVELGLHNCYGDYNHKHFHEPTSLAEVVERAEAILAYNSHPLKWFHVPVPLSAMDKLESYLSPLKKLTPRFRADGTELYLGAVHFRDVEGTKQRIEAAQRVLGNVDFGLATECGWGRTPAEQIEDIMNISTSLTEAVA